MQIKLSRIKYKGTCLQGKYDEEAHEDTYTPTFSFYYGIYHQTEQYRLQAQQLYGFTNTTFEILVRHPNQLKLKNLVKLQDGINYDILDINEDPEINGFDIVTVQNSPATPRTDPKTHQTIGYSEDDNNAV